MADRRFPPPWSVEELDACFVVTDNAGQKLAYVHFEVNPDGAQRRNCLCATRREELPGISPSCRS
jgi:hypothetical protein